MHRSFRLAFRLVLCVAAPLLWAAPSAANPDYCDRPLRVALFEFGVLYQTTTNDGIDARLLDTLEKHSGCTFERSVRPRARIWKELEAGTLDIATAAIPTPERKAYLYFSPYLRTRNVVLVRKGSAAPELTQAALEAGSLKLGRVRGFRHEEAYDALLSRLAPQGRVTEAADVAELLRMLDRKVVDAVFSQPVVYRQYWDAEKITADFDLYDWAPADQFSVGALVFARKSFTPAQAKRWDALVVKLLKDGTIGKIMRDYLDAASARELVYSGPRLPD